MNLQDRKEFMNQKVDKSDPDKNKYNNYGKKTTRKITNSEGWYFGFWYIVLLTLITVLIINKIGWKL